MAVKFQDYYEVLEIPRNAPQDDVNKAYRKLARKFHPDINKSKDAEERFKQIGEAYEVLKDPDKRKRYDTLGSNWQTGQDFTPPPGWDFNSRDFGTGPQGGGGFSFDIGDIFGESGFSDFFKTLFGDSSGGSGPRGNRRTATWISRGHDEEVKLTISLSDAYHGGRKTLTLEVLEGDGENRRTTRNYEVTIPSGITEGKRLRLSGQGQKGVGGGPAGDLYLRIHIAPHPVFRIKGSDLEVDVPVTPWEAALGGRIEVPTMDGRAAVKIPAGIQSGKKIRIRGKGLIDPGKNRGDLYAVLQITVSQQLGQEEKKLYEELSKISTFKPRE